MARMWLRFARKTTTAAAVSGSVVVEGRVLPHKTLSIPSSPTKPVFFDLTVESFRSVGGRPGWNVASVDTQIMPFILEDDAGQIWISAERDQVVVKGGWIEHGASSRARYSARLIAPGDTVRVRGEVFESRRAPVGRGLRATEERPLEILFRKRGDPALAQQGARSAEEAKPPPKNKRRAKSKK
jgi:hypothetical protein